MTLDSSVTWDHRDSGAMLNGKDQAILPSDGLTEPHIRKFMAASKALAAQAGIQHTAP